MVPSFQSTLRLPLNFLTRFWVIERPIPNPDLFSLIIPRLDTRYFSDGGESPTQAPIMVLLFSLFSFLKFHI